MMVNLAKRHVYSYRSRGSLKRVMRSCSVKENVMNKQLVKQQNYLRSAKTRILFLLTLLMVSAMIGGCASEQAAGEKVKQESAGTEHGKQEGSGAENAGSDVFSQNSPGTDRLSQETAFTDNLEIHFLDVGQGLSIFARCGSQTMLYDGGDRNHSSFVVSYLKSQQIDTLDYLIASHYDSDHINGLIGALNVFDVKTIIGSDYEHSSKEYQSFMSKAGELGKEVIHPSVGDTYSFGDAVFTVLAPETITNKSNNNSVAIKIEHGKNSFIVTGDAEYDSEMKMAASGMDLQCNVLVAGHHGSASSTTWDFLKSTCPEYAIISAGSGNSYGHPHGDTMEKLEIMEIEVFRTDKQGTIVAISDGSIITWNTEPCNDYSAGNSGKGITEVTEPAETTGNEGTAGIADTAAPYETNQIPASAGTTYVLNTNSKKVHYPACSSVKKISANNYQESNDDLDVILDRGYSRCGICMK